MLSRSRLSILRSLRQKKNRREQQLFVAEGAKLVSELLDSSFEVETVYATVRWLRENSKLAATARETVAVDMEEMSRISSQVTPQEVMAVAHIPAHKLSLDSLGDKYTLVLDGIRDPGNLGTIIRIADWFGIENIICSPDSAEAWNPKVVQASMGSILRVRVHETNLEHFFQSLKKETALPVYGTFLEGKSIYQSAFPKSGGVLVIGNESTGIRPETEQYITEKITIPSWSVSSESGPESLNAAVATAIACSEIRRNMAVKGYQATKQ
jgi:RNA methyltransferase, TrmH family